MVFKLYVFKMCFKVFSKISHRFQCFQIVCFKVFSKFLTGFNGFQIMCFIVFSKFLTGFNGFQIVFSKCVSKCFQIMFQNVFKNPHRFQWFSNDAFESVFKIYVFQSVFKNLITVSMVFK